MNSNEIKARIRKAEALAPKIDEATQGETGLTEMVREAAIADVLFELLASLGAGESLEQAIETIHSNF